MGALWSIYELILSYMTCSYIYPWEMNVATKRKDNKTVMGHKKHNSQKWNITRSLDFGSEISLRMENRTREQQDDGS